MVLSLFEKVSQVFLKGSKFYIEGVKEWFIVCDAVFGEGINKPLDGVAIAGKGIYYPAHGLY